MNGGFVRVFAGSAAGPDSTVCVGNLSVRVECGSMGYERSGVFMTINNDGTPTATAAAMNNANT